MKNEFKPGDFARFSNKEIPRILDILRANGYDCPSYVVESYKNAVGFGQSHQMHSFDSTYHGYDNELSRHHFIVIALRLEKGMGISVKDSTREQRIHICDKMASLGINQYLDKDERLKQGQYDNSFYFDGNEWLSCDNRDLYITNAIPYLDWCKRLCIEPIGIESSTEPVFDPSKPFEVMTDISHEIWSARPNAYYVGKDSSGNHVIQLSDGYYAYSFIRNIQEFNAGMLGVGEHMVVNDPEFPFLDGHLLRMTVDRRLFNMDHDCMVLNPDAPYIKGRRVNVEIKVI